MKLRDCYASLSAEREEFVERGVRSALLTIPAVFARSGTSRHQLPQNFQSVGARGVNMLTSKLALTLFPPTLPFMRLSLSEVERDRLLGGDNGAQVVDEVDQSLLKIEQQADSDFDQSGWRPAVSEALRLAVVTGNALIYDRPGGRPATYCLHDYVVERDPDGTVQKIVLEQKLSKASAISQLGAEAMAVIDAAVREYEHGTTTHYTVHSGAIREKDGTFSFWEEIGGMPVAPKQEGIKEANLPLIPLMFQAVYKSSYGRGYVEDYDGHLLNLEKVSRSLSEGAQALAKIIWLIKPGSTTKAHVINKAPNLAIRQGDVEDVGALRADKGGDLGFALQFRQILTAEISAAFLLNSSIQRNGERVTAEEIRLMAGELEDALGGVYSSLADTIQAPIVHYLFNKLKAEKKISIPKEVVPVIATGLEAISRNHKAARIHQALATVLQLIGPDRMDEVLRRGAVASDIMTAHNLDAARYILTDEEVAANQEAMQAQQMQMAAIGPGIQAMSKAQGQEQ
jgi:predicted nuclease with RNAse H fold